MRNGIGTGMRRISGMAALLTCLMVGSATAGLVTVTPANDSVGVVAVWTSTDGSGRFEMSRLTPSPVSASKISADYAGISETDPVTALVADRDDRGSVFISWQTEDRIGPETIHHVKAARVSGDGLLEWGPVLVRSNTVEAELGIIPDRNGGAYMTSAVVGLESLTNDAIEVHFVDSTGTKVWTRQFGATGADFRKPRIVTDGKGGVIVVFEAQGLTDGSVRHLFAQRLDSTGQLMWGFGEVCVILAATTGDEHDPVLIPEDGGLIAVFQSTVVGGKWDGNPNMAAQKIGADGARVWNGGSPVLVSRTTAAETAPSVVSDGNGGIVVAFEGTLDGEKRADIWMQHVSTSGDLAWGSGMPVALTSSDDDERGPELAVLGDTLVAVSYSITTGSAVTPVVNMVTLNGSAAWDGPRNLLESGKTGGIISLWQQVPGSIAVLMEGQSESVKLELRTVTIHGVESSVPTAVAATPRPADVEVMAWPNPFNAVLTISVSIPTAGMVQVKLFNALGQRVRTMSARVSARRHDFIWNGTDDTGVGLASGTYFYLVTGEVESLARPVAGRVTLAR